MAQQKLWQYICNALRGMSSVLSRVFFNFRAGGVAAAAAAATGDARGRGHYCCCWEVTRPQPAYGNML